jgi:hypothetical protein
LTITKNDSAQWRLTKEQGLDVGPVERRGTSAMSRNPTVGDVSD